MSSHRCDLLTAFVYSHPWAVLPEMLPVIYGIVDRRQAGIDVDQSEIDAALVNRKNLPQPRAGSVAIIPIYGVIAPKMNMVSNTSGGATLDVVTSQLRASVADKAIKTIVLDIDSPGGNVAGATEFAHELLRARAKKSVIAQVQYTGTSLAYWAASCCTHIYAAPSARVGSIGVVMAHEDRSGELANEGVKRTYLYAGEGKTDGNDSEPLSEQASARMVASVEEAYGHFVGDVIKGRGQGMTSERVRKEWKAHVYGAAEALSIGMIDGIATLDDTLARILSASPDAADQRAAQLLSASHDTAQEPSPATAQDRARAFDLERELFEMQL